MDAPSFERHRVRLRLARDVTFPFEHGGVLRGVLSGALKRHKLPAGLMPYACESGCVRFRAGDAYVFGLTLAGEALDEAEPLLQGLESLGGRRPKGPAPVLGGNFVVEAWDRLPPPDLDADARAVMDGDVEVVLVSPLRVERPPELKRRGAGYLNGDCFPAPWLLELLWRRLFLLAHGCYPEAAERDAMPEIGPGVVARPETLLWIDIPVRGTEEKGRPYTLGGVRGSFVLEGLSQDWRRLLVLGAYLHVGQKTHYGLGRYVVTGTSEASAPAFAPGCSLLECAAREDVLERACEHVLADEEEPEEPDLGRLHRQLLAGRYEPPPLHGFVEPKDDGGVRPLAVPSLRDRVAQRAAVEVLAPALDTLLEDSSFAYRKGFSRQGAARAIELAYADGYRYVLDADIEAFFDQVDWGVLFGKLRALYPYEPLLDLVERWVRAPVVFDGRRITRRRGLPQGSPVSPLLANLYLDTFDEALMDRGFRLVRYADDFVVLTRDVEMARHARKEVADELAELRLALNAEKTAIRSIDDGFSYLGYLFCRSVVIEQKDEEGETAPDRLEPEDVPEGSWLAAVPFARLQELVEKGPGESRRGVIERVPLTAEGPLGAPARRPLYVTSPDTKLFLRRETLVMKPPGGEEMDVPISSLSHVVFWGRTRATVPVLLAMARRGVPGYFCRVTGELEATFEPQGTSWPLWLEQARFAEDEARCLAFAAEIVDARLRNLAALAVRFGWDGAAEAAAEMRTLAREVSNKTATDSLRGLEGRGAALAFGALGRSLPPEWGFEGRARRPPPDPVNAMLSFGYTLLHNHASTALVAAGLHPRIGLFHRPRGAHHALASDLIEETRHLVEALVWTLVRRRQLRPDQDFRPSPDGRYPALLTPEARRTFLDAFERRLMTSFTPEGEEEPTTYREFLARQARQVRGLVSGELALYRPLVLRA